MNKCILKIEVDGKLNWFELDESGCVIRSQEFTEYSSLPRSTAQLVVLIPGQEVYLEQVKLPKMSGKSLSQALPFVLEDKVVGEVAQFYIVAAKITGSENHLIAAIQRERFETIYAKLQANNLRPSAIVPDFFAYPIQDGKWSLKLRQKDATLRIDTYSGFTVEQAYCEFALANTLQKRDQETPIECSVINDGVEFNQEKFHNKLQFFIEEKDRFDLQLFSEKPVINFLHGEYRAKKPSSQKKSSWPVAGWLGAILIVIVIGGKLVEWKIYQSQYHAQKTLVSTTVAQLLPTAANNDNPKQFIEHELHRLSSQKFDDTFIELLADVGKTLQGSPAVELQTLNYSDDTLSLKFKASKLSDLEGFSRALEQQQHLKITDSQVSVNNKSVFGEFKVGRK